MKTPNARSEPALKRQSTGAAVVPLADFWLTISRRVTERLAVCPSTAAA